MGPGLFLLLAVLAGSVRAVETPVGLDARGVDPMTAVDNRQGLDVRDELGRPVSAQAVLGELKKAQVARVGETAFATALPKARLVLTSLEYALAGALSLVQLAEFPAVPTAWTSLPLPRPRVPALLLVVLAAVAASTAAVLRPRALQVCLLPCQRCPEVLRC